MKEQLLQLKQVDELRDAYYLLHDYMLTLFALRLISGLLLWLKPEWQVEGYVLICIGIVLANIVNAFRHKKIRVEHITSLAMAILFYCLASNSLVEKWI